MPAVSAIVLFGSACYSAARPATNIAPDRVKAGTPVIVWQPSHQTDTGTDFNEAAVGNGIAEAAMKPRPVLNERKVWSFGVPGLHHANTGSNTMIEHTPTVVDDQRSGYAYELLESNTLMPTVFIAIHNNSGTNRHAVWGNIHDGDTFEGENRALAARLVGAIAAATDLEDRGVLLDRPTGRNN